MIIERGNIRLVRLTEEYIELVRTWRNDPDIQKTMEYREYITPEQQKEWFKKIDNLYNNYFLIQIAGNFIGLIYGADIDWDNNVTNNGGIFIWDKKYLESAEVLWASLLLTDLGFYLGMKKNYIKILQDNYKSIAFNKALGYVLLPGQEGVYNQQYELTPEAYLKATEKVRRYSEFSNIIRLKLPDAEHYTYVNVYKRIETAKSKYDSLMPFELIEL